MELVGVALFAVWVTWFVVLGLRMADELFNAEHSGNKTSGNDLDDTETKES